MNNAQDKVSPPKHWAVILRRIIMIVAFAALVGVVMQHLSAAMERRPQPAGFVRGVLQGALMPCALPNLLVGRDVNIYSQNNTGLTYKLGYTVGVNTCGAIFFGVFFWRLNRWRKRMNKQSETS